MHHTIDANDVVDLFWGRPYTGSWKWLLLFTLGGTIVFGVLFWNSPEGRAYRALEITEAEYRDLASTNRLEEVWIDPGWVTARLTYPLERAGKSHRMVVVGRIWANIRPDLQLWAPSLDSSRVHIAK